MRDVFLIRSVSIDDGVFGHLIHEDFHLHTCEPEDSRPGNKGHIPTGMYPVQWEPVGKFQGYAVKNVPGFSDIEIHIGNDELDTRGCILLGLRRGLGARNKEAVLNSGQAIARFNSYMNHEPFMLHILDTRQLKGT